MHQAEKTSKEIAETTKIGLRTVQRIIEIWKDSGEPSSLREKCGRKKILTDRDRRSLKLLVKSNRRKTTVELRAMFDSESKSISKRTMRKELKGLGLNSFVALRKPLISEANGKKRLKFAREHKDWTLEQWKMVLFNFAFCPIFSTLNKKKTVIVSNPIQFKQVQFSLLELFI